MFQTQSSLNVDMCLLFPTVTKYSCLLSQGHRCPVCDKVFAQRHNMLQHQRQVHGDEKPFACDHCDKRFKRKSHLKDHVQTMHTSDGATTSGASPPSSPPQPSTSSGSTGQKRGATETDPPTSPPPKKPLTTIERERQLVESLPSGAARDMYQEHFNAVRTHERHGRVQHTYNHFWDPTQDFPDWRDYLRFLFNSQRHRFKINFSHSFLMENIETDELRFYHASVNNNAGLERPRLIQNHQDFEQFLQDIEDIDMLQQAQMQRENSKWSVSRIMATSFYVYPLDFPIA